MRTVIMEIGPVETVSALHIYLQDKLDLPAHYGRNLDALYDALTEMDEDTLFVIRAEGIRGENAAYLSRLVRVFEDAALENGHLNVQICQIGDEAGGRPELRRHQG